MAITALPSPPLRSDPVTFPDKADAMMTALPVFVTEANVLQTDVNAKQTTASTAATTATTKASEASASATTATTKASEASTSAATALSTVTTITQMKNDTISAISLAAFTEDWGLVTEAVTSTTDYGVM